MFEPTWTMPKAWSSGRDPLGLQATSVRLYRQLVPGLTNVTNRLRYFSFYCWVVRSFELTTYRDDALRWQLFIRRAEAIYALAAHLVDGAASLGMAGGDWAERIKGRLGDRLELAPHTDAPDTSGQYLKAKRGNMGQFYVASMLEAGMLGRLSPTPRVTNTFGADLARAFDHAVGPAAGALREGIETAVVARDALELIGLLAHPARIVPESEEQQLLLQYLLGRGETLNDAAARRRDSAWLRLELMTRGIGPQDDAALRRALYARVLPDGEALDIAGATINGWRAYQANELASVALGALLNGLVSQLDGREDEPDAVISALLDATLEGRVAERGWSSWAASLVDLDEDEVVAPVLATTLEGKTGDAAIWRGAIELIGLLWIRWSQNQEGLRSAIAAAAGAGGRSLANVLEWLSSHANSNVASAIHSMLKRCVISEHMAIAGQKLANSGTFTYHFLLTDGLMSDGKLGIYTYTTPRIPNLARFMSDAGLHLDGVPTEAGWNFLNGHQAH